MSQRNAEQRTDQKSIGQPIVQCECNGGNNVDRLGGDEQLVSVRSRRHRVPDARELTVINVRNGFDVEEHCGLYSRQRKHGHGVRYYSPLDMLPSAMDRVKQRSHAFKEQNDENPWDEPNELSGHVYAGV